MNILVVGMRFYNYEQSIKKELEKQGHNVTLISDSSKNNNLNVRLFSKRIVSFLNRKSQQKVLKSIDLDSFNIILVIVGRFLSNYFFETIKKENMQAKFILYLWDDIARVKNFNLIKNYYDLIYTFDFNDSLNFGINFLPLFYPNEFKKNHEYEKKYHLYGSFSNHSDRINVIQKVVKQFVFDNMLFYVNLGLYGYFKRIIKSQHKKDNYINVIKYIPTPISKKSNIKLMNESIAVLDIQFEGQNGLTIRTLESLACQNKLITTNQNVKFYDFYNENNIFILDRNNPIINPDFFNSKFEVIEYEILSKYSIASWSNVIINNIEMKYTKLSLEQIKKTNMKG